MSAENPTPLEAVADFAERFKAEGRREMLARLMDEFDSKYHLYGGDIGTVEVAAWLESRVTHWLNQPWPDADAPRRDEAGTGG